MHVLRARSVSVCVCVGWGAGGGNSGGGCSLDNNNMVVEKMVISMALVPTHAWQLFKKLVL